MIDWNEMNLSMGLLLPLADIKEEKADDFFRGNENLLINGYYIDNNNMDFSIKILFKYTKSEEKLKKMMADENTRTSKLVRADGSKIILCVIRLSETYRRDISKISNGNQKYISDEAKRKIIEFWKNKGFGRVSMALFGYEEFDIMREILEKFK